MQYKLLHIISGTYVSKCSYIFPSGFKLPWLRLAQGTRLTPYYPTPITYEAKEFNTKDEIKAFYKTESKLDKTFNEQEFEIIEIDES